ncbi:MAG: hypothetical protein U0236_17975 [Nitrospira sp.]
MRYQRGELLEIHSEPRPSEFWLWHDRLNVYSLLVVAQFTQAVTNSLPESFLVAAKRELGDYPPGRYAECGFPLAGAFLLKLELQYDETARTRASDVFHRLLALDASVRTDPSMLRAYWLARRSGLDGISHGFLSSHGFPISHGKIYSAIEFDRRIFDKIGTTEENHVEIFLFDALWSFVRFCNDLHELLLDIDDRAVAGLVRHYYAHILDAFSGQRSPQLQTIVRAVLNLVFDLVENEPHDKDNVEEQKQSYHRLVDAYLAVTNREQWPLPSTLEFLLTDQQPQFTQ